MSYLTREQLQNLRQALDKLKEETQLVVNQTSEGARPVKLDQSMVGRLSRMDAIQQQQMSQSNRRTAEQRLRLISIAMANIDSGDYGYCRQCDNEIGFQRLQARPETIYCVVCQEQKEQQD